MLLVLMALQVPTETQEVITQTPFNPQGTAHMVTTSTQAMIRRITQWRM
ncbi:MAG: hypothetical protein JSV32_02005 [Dehalococcoidia bacterium]|nr:MAG: hypothetical protein JSV32_02005 [Dehalococcoidia bacterium]